MHPDAQQEIIKGCLPATQNPPHFMQNKNPEESHSRSSVGNRHVWRWPNNANKATFFFFKGQNPILCFCFCLMLILTLTLGPLEGRTRLMIFNFRAYYGYMETKHLPFIKTDKIWNPSWLLRDRKVLVFVVVFFSGYRCLSSVLVVQHIEPCFKHLFSSKDGSCELGNVQCDWKGRLVSVFLFRIPECVFVKVKR